MDSLPCWHCCQRHSGSPCKGRLPTPSARRRNTLPLLLQKVVHAAALHSTHHRTEAEQPHSVSIQHYDHFRLSPPKYRRYGLMVRRHNIVTARLRLGYRPVWQVSEAGDIPHFSNCRLCNTPNANSLHHYCLECPSVRDRLPQGRPLHSVCDFILKDNNLDVILVQHPHFGGC